MQIYSGKHFNQQQLHDNVNASQRVTLHCLGCKLEPCRLKLKLTGNSQEKHFVGLRL